MKKIKNNTTEAKIWCGQTIQPGDYYEINLKEEKEWMYDSNILEDIENNKLIISNGLEDISGIKNSIDFLQNIDKYSIVFGNAGNTSSGKYLNYSDSVSNTSPFIVPTAININKISFRVAYNTNCAISILVNGIVKVTYSLSNINKITINDIKLLVLENDEISIKLSSGSCNSINVTLFLG